MGYRHRTLAGPTAIRLLRLHPKRHNDKLTCSLIHTTHGSDSTLQYEALSYAWGPPKFTESVDIEDDSATGGWQAMPITANLSEALFALRHDDHARWLWVDAISIDQTNIEEKNHQVAQMGAIYKNAQAVVVWLGLQRSPSSGAFITERRLSARKPSGAESDPSDKPNTTRVLKRALDAASVNQYHFSRIRRLRSLAEEWSGETIEFFTAPWCVTQVSVRVKVKTDEDCHRFSRVWVVQEFVLASKIQFAHGREMLDLDTISRTAQALARCHDEFLLSGSVSLEKGTPLREVLFQAAKLWDLLSLRQDYSHVEKPSLLRCFLDLSRNRSCSDDRDRIYAMLGIAGSHTVTPDYDMSLEDILLDFATRSLCTGQFSLLHDNSLGPRVFSNCSFVPCLLKRASQPLSMENTNEAFRAGGSRAVAVRNLCPGKVAIRGVEIDSIVASVGFADRSKGLELISDVAALQDDNVQVGTLTHWSRVEDVYTQCKAWLQTRRPSRTSLPKRLQLKNSQLKRTLTSGAPPAQRRSRNARGASSTAQHRTSSPSLLDDEDARLNQLNKFTRNRVLFWTASGSLGLGNRYLRVGDTVVIFDGAQTPFVLRSASPSASDAEWTLVGDCYLDGWMDGEFAGHDVKEEVDVAPTEKSIWTALERKVLRGAVGSKRPVLVRREFVLR